MIADSDTALARDLLEFIDRSPSPWHAVESLRSRLDEAGFESLDETRSWSLTPGNRYYVIRDGSSIILFTAGEGALVENGFRIVGAHTDSPGLRIKPNPIICNRDVVRLGVEIYGGPILATFTDRDLSLAGRATFKNRDHTLETRLVNFETPMLRLPNLAIHMNRRVNEDGLKLDRQTQLPPLLSVLPENLESEPEFTALLADRMQLDPTALLSWDLAVFDTQKGALYGTENEFLANSQLDNLASCHAGLHAILNQQPARSAATHVCAFFDHEEIGSQSMKGADGSFLPDTLERIATALDCRADDFRRALAHSFMISADMAHAYHPGFPSAYEPDHPVFVNRGPVIKINANQRYTSESVSDARFVSLCEDCAVPWQKYTHRTDLPCGSTIGPMTAARLGIRSVDVGNPMWAMHSARESAGVPDHGYMTRVLTRFFSDT